MKRVRRQDTAPELRVRRYLHARGLRFTLHDRRLPGCPDLVLPCRHCVVLVHGCFWHGHRCRHGRVHARTNADYWAAKVADNRARDRRQQRALQALGWTVEVIWECESADEGKLSALAARLLQR
jgi:DNA mismatch endonuclease, patch repair protein